MTSAAMKREPRKAGIELIKRAIAEHDPVAIYALFSGGDDSIVSTHLSMGIAEMAVHIDTTIFVRQNREHALAVIKRFEWAHRIIRPDTTYRDLVLKFGFPGPAAHYLPYRLLKERAIRKLVREAKRKTGDRVMLITGARRSESARRMGYVEPIVRVGGQVWVAPLYDWSTAERDSYIEENDLSRNPVKPFLHISGDCLCGAFGKRYEFNEIKLWFPESASEIEKLQEEAKTAGVHCKWGTRPPKDTLTRELPFMPLCIGCEAVRP